MRLNLMRPQRILPLVAMVAVLAPTPATDAQDGRRARAERQRRAGQRAAARKRARVRRNVRRHRHARSHFHRRLRHRFHDRAHRFHDVRFHRFRHRHDGLGLHAHVYRADRDRDDPRADEPDDKPEIDVQEWTEGAWRRLRWGHEFRALRAFARVAAHRPHDGTLKVGYALAAAGARKLETGVWAMRKAVLTDPSGVAELDLHNNILERIPYLVRDYIEDFDDTEHDADRAFMLAALHYLRAKKSDAQTYLDRACSLGDGHESVGALQRLVAALPDPDEAAEADAADGDDASAEKATGRPSAGRVR